MDAALAHLIDARAIEQLIFEYFDRIDSLDPFGAADLFAEEATAELMTGKVYRGRSEIGRALARILLQYRCTSHHVSNHRSHIDGDGASAHSYVYAFHRLADSDRTWHLWARTADRLRRIDGSWQITERVLVPVDAEPEWDRIDPSWFTGHPGRNAPEVIRRRLEAAYQDREILE